MDVRQLQYFVRVYEERSFSRAAEKANVVQPALSMQIRRLEEELSASLFDRAPRGLEPTAAGHRLYERCLPIIHDLAGLRQEISELVGGGRVTGSIRLGSPPSVNRGVLGEVLSQFAEKYPDVEITVTEAYSNHVTALLQEGALDLALGAAPSENTGLSFRTALKDRLLLVAGSAVNGPTLTPCRLAGMSNIKLILPTRRSFLGNTMMDYIASGEINPSRVMKIDGVTATIETARCSDWAAVFPFIAMVKDLDRSDLYIYPIVDLAAQFDLYFVHDPRRPLTAASRAFVEMLDASLRDIDRKRLALFPAEQKFG